MSIEELLEESHKMSYDDFCQEQISRKGYVCPANIWNPDLYEKSAVEICPDCEHYNDDCIVYGKKKGRGKEKIKMTKSELKGSNKACDDIELKE